jgi:hypothetical protein
MTPLLVCALLAKRLVDLAANSGLVNFYAGYPIIFVF